MTTTGIIIRTDPLAKKNLGFPGTRATRPTGGTLVDFVALFPGHIRLAAVLVALALAPMGSAMAQQAGDGAPPATPVGVSTTQERISRQMAPAVGHLVPRRAGEVAALSSGAVAVFAVDVGDRVKQGALLVQLDPETLALEVALAEAEVQQKAAALEEARSRLALSQQALDRLEGLRRSSAFSRANFDDKAEEVTGNTHAVTSAEAALAIARSALKLAQADLRDTSIRAPYDGVIERRHTEVGAYVTKGTPVVSLINPDDLEVEADIPFQLVTGLTPGDAVRVMLDDDTGVQATLRAIVPIENVRTRTWLARFTLPEDITRTHRLAAHQSVTLRLPDGPERLMVTVPKDAVIANPSGTMVFVVVDGVAQPRPIVLGQAIRGSFEVLRGLSTGETVVTRGNERLSPGQPVIATVPPSARGSAGPDPSPSATVPPEG